MRSVLARSKVIPVIVFILTTLIIQGTAWALGQGCVACQPPPAPVALRNHVPAASLLYQAQDVLLPPRAATPPRQASFAAPTRFPRSDPPEAATGGFGIWSCIAEHESGGNWQYNDGQFEGGLNFLNSTWLAAGGGRYAQHAYDATPAQQVEIARSWLAKTSWSQWPETSKMCGM